MSPVLLHPVMTERASLQAERENALQFVVDRRATRTDVRREVEKRFGVKVLRVRTLISPRGQKKAVVRLGPDHKAEEVLAKIGVF
ncbi:MAG: 50S ribosomal protein L23 [Halobacteria archaeon]